MFHDVKAYSQEQDEETGRPWNLSDRQIHRYIRRSDQLLVQYLEKDREKLLARAVVQREALIARSIESSDYRTALACMVDRDKLYGLYPDGKPSGPTGLFVLNVKEEIVIPKTVPPLDVIDHEQQHNGSTAAPDHSLAPCPAGILE
jgi:hypothetical protein